MCTYVVHVFTSLAKKDKYNLDDEGVTITNICEEVPRGKHILSHTEFALA